MIVWLGFGNAFQLLLSVALSIHLFQDMCEHLTHQVFADEKLTFHLRKFIPSSVSSFVRWSVFDACTSNTNNRRLILFAPFNLSLMMLRPFGYGGRRGAQQWHVSEFRTKSGMLWCFFKVFVASSSSISAFVVDTQPCRSAMRTNTPCGVRFVACPVQGGGPPWCQWVFRLVRSGLFCSSGFCLRLCVARFFGWLRLVEVFVCGPVERWARASCFIAVLGHRRPPRHVRTARVLEVGSQWHGYK